MFYSLIEQQLPIQILQNFFLHKIIPNAILISGIEGTGKKKAAITFAMLCNCQSHNFSESSTLNLIDMEPCGKCSSCKKILSATHPDIHIIEPVGKFIVISQIRSMVSSLVQKPYEAKMRFIIIYDAHTMNVESANSLLKSLEEPPARTTIILLSSKPSNLLPTILSRCRQIKFNPISKQTILDTLINTYHIDPEIANITASMANGSLLMALKFANADSGTKDWVGMRNRLLTELTNLFLNSGKYQRSISDALALAERISKQKEDINFFLEIIKTYLRDFAIILYCRQKGSELTENYINKKLINSDKSKIIWETSQIILIETIQKIIKEIEVAERKINSNANIRLTLELLFLEFIKK